LTVLSDYVARMVDGGMDQSEAMQIAAELFAAGVASAALRPSKAVLRTRKWRHKTSQNVTSDIQSAASENVTNRHETSQSVTCDNAPLSSSNSLSRKRGERLSPDWMPTEADRTFAKQLGWSESQIDSESANFRDYWIAKPGSGGCKLDWPATWRKWVRSSKVKPAGNGIGAAPGDAKMPLDDAVAQFAKLGRWSRHSPVTDVSQVPVELLAKHGLEPDGRKVERGQ
jgi:hypothetical protein